MDYVIMNVSVTQSADLGGTPKPYCTSEKKEINKASFALRIESVPLQSPTAYLVCF